MTVPLDYLVGILVFGHNYLCSVCLGFGVYYLIFVFSILGVESISVSILSVSGFIFGFCRGVLSRFLFFFFFSGS